MAFLEVKDISGKQGDVSVVNHVSFSLEKGERLGIAGSTGSGKTSLLKLIAGLLQPATGEIFFAGEKLRGPEDKLIPGHSAIAYLSQFFELRNHYRVNEILQLKNRLDEERANELLQLCRIQHLTGRWAHQLSGGERQRVALASLLLSAPSLFLLDEPYSQLDAVHRRILKEVIEEAIRMLGMSCIQVSHDPADLLPWADQVLVLQHGKQVQLGAPEEVYWKPVNEYTAALFGHYLQLDPSFVPEFQKFSTIDLKACPFLRPGHFQLAETGIKAEVENCFFMGSYYECDLTTEAGPVRLILPRLLLRGATVHLVIRTSELE